MDRLRSWLSLRPGNVFAPYTAGSLGVAALAALGTAAGLALGVPPVIAWTLGLSLLAVALLLVAVFAVAGRREARQVADLLAGEIWARWTYPLADEERLGAEEWRRTKATVRQSLGSAVLAGAIVGGTMAFSGLGAAIAAASGGGIAGLMLLIAAGIFWRGRRRYDRRRDSSREVVFGSHALLKDGVYLQLSGPKARLQGVALGPADGDGPGAIAIPELRFDRLVERRSTSSGSSDLWWLEIFTWSQRYWAKSPTGVPVPTGCEAEAEALAERYRRRHSLDTGPRPTPSSGAEPRVASVARSS